MDSLPTPSDSASDSDAAAAEWPLPREGVAVTHLLIVRDVARLRRFGATAKARDRLQFTAGTPLDEGLQRTIEWTRTNRATIRRCMLQHASLMPELRTAYR